MPPISHLPLRLHLPLFLPRNPSHCVAAHNNILRKNLNPNPYQVTRRILNFQGAAVPRHLADQLASYEQTLAQRNGADMLAS